MTQNVAKFSDAAACKSEIIPTPEFGTDRKLPFCDIADYISDARKRWKRKKESFLGGLKVRWRGAGGKLPGQLCGPDKNPPAAQGLKHSSS